VAVPDLRGTGAPRYAEPACHHIALPPRSCLSFGLVMRPLGTSDTAEVGTCALGVCRSGRTASHLTAVAYRVGWIGCGPGRWSGGIGICRRNSQLRTGRARHPCRAGLFAPFPPLYRVPAVRSPLRSTRLCRVWLFPIRAGQEPRATPNRPVAISLYPPPAAACSPVAEPLSRSGRLLPGISILIISSRMRCGCKRKRLIYESDPFHL